MECSKVKRTAPRQQKNNLGQWLCRVPSCLKLVAKGRRSYCSRECAEEFEIAYFPSRTRNHVYMRDRGVCALCGCDTELLRRILHRARMGRRAWSGGDHYKAALHAARELGFNGVISAGDFWQADHIQECVNGGWGKGLDNFRTLCTPCHKAETARLARELAERRKANGVASNDGSLFAESA